MKDVPVLICPSQVCLGPPYTRTGLRTSKLRCSSGSTPADKMSISYQADKRSEEGPADLPPDARLVANHFFNVPVKPVHTYRRK